MSCLSTIPTDLFTHVLNSDLRMLLMVPPAEGERKARAARPGPRTSTLRPATHQTEMKCAGDELDLFPEQPLSTHVITCF